MKSGRAREIEQFVTTIHNPEVGAMAAIVEILDELPDPAARLRVMRWAFAKYSDEFKRPVGHAADAPADAEPAPPGPVLVVSAPRPAAKADLVELVPAAPVAERSIAEDIEEQIAELDDLFPRASTPPIDL